jgi:Ca-activated chloride channel family protein
MILQTKPGGETSLYDALLKGIALATESLLPRQAIVLISDGADTHSTHMLDEVRRATRESTTQIFAIGYYSPEEAQLFRTSSPTVKAEDGKVIDNPREVLKQLAEDSGARSFFPESDQELQAATTEIAADIKAQYTIAFYPPGGDENQYHRLQVTVRDRKDQVRVRSGYWSQHPN